jgi:hypothetical protein
VVSDALFLVHSAQEEREMEEIAMTRKAVAAISEKVQQMGSATVRHTLNVAVSGAPLVVSCPQT